MVAISSGIAKSSYEDRAGWSTEQSKSVKVVICEDDAT